MVCQPPGEGAQLLESADQSGCYPPRVRQESDQQNGKSTVECDPKLMKYISDHVKEQ